MHGMVRVGACQTPEILGDPPAALGCMLRFAREAEEKKIDLLLFPECFLSGYVLEGAYLAKHSFDLASERFAAVLKRLERVRPALVFGVSERRAETVFNSVVVVEGGKLKGVYRKTHLIDPNETRLFAPGKEYPIFEIKGLKYGMNICYDAQFAEAAKAVADQGARLLLLPAQNMLRRESAERWRHRHNEIRSERVRENGLWFLSSDVTGIRPPGPYGVERIAYGPTLAMNPRAEVVARVPLMTVGLIAVDIPVVSQESME